MSDAASRMIPMAQAVLAEDKELMGLPPPTPKELICPITQELMVDPVFAEDGFTYERISMERWFSTGKRRSPVTNEILTDRSTQLTPNKVMKNMIQNYRREIGTKLIAACKVPVNEPMKSIDGAEDVDLEQQSKTSEGPKKPLSSLALASYIEAGADVNVRDEDGNSPLMLLLQQGRIQLSHEILEYGARASQRNDLGTSPINLCEKLKESNHMIDSSKSISANKNMWDDMMNTLETISAKEVIEDDLKEKEREVKTKSERERLSELEREESRGGGGANEAMDVAEALRRAHIGPGIGFFPSLFALQFQSGMTHPLLRPNLVENAGPGEVNKLRLIDRVFKLGVALLAIYLIFVV